MQTLQAHTYNVSMDFHQCVDFQLGLYVPLGRCHLMLSYLSMFRVTYNSIHDPSGESMACNVYQPSLVCPTSKIRLTCKGECYHYLV